MSLRKHSALIAYLALGGLGPSVKREELRLADPDRPREKSPHATGKKKKRNKKKRNKKKRGW